MKVKLLQSCPTLCDPMDCSPPGSSVHGIFQARVLEWVAIAFSYKQHEASTKSLDNLNSASTVGTFVLSLLSRVQLFATLWAVAHQAPLSMGFSKQEYQSGLPFPSPGVLPNPGIEPAFLISPALADGFFTTVATWETPVPTVLP